MAHSTDFEVRPKASLRLLHFISDAWAYIFEPPDVAIAPIYALLDNDDADGVRDLLRQRPRLLRHLSIVQGDLLAQRLARKQMACFEALAPLAIDCQQSAKIMMAAVRAAPASYLPKMRGLGLYFAPSDCSAPLLAATKAADLDWVNALAACCSSACSLDILYDACSIDVDEQRRQEIMELLLLLHPQPSARFEALALAVSWENLGAIKAILSLTSPQDLAQAGSAGTTYPHGKVFSSTSAESRPQPLEVAASCDRVDILGMLLPILGSGIDGSNSPALKAAARAERGGRIAAAKFIHGWIRSHAELVELNAVLAPSPNQEIFPAPMIKPRRL